MLSRYKAYITQFSRTEDLNKRIYARNYPSQNLTMSIPFRSITTRTTLPVPIKQNDTNKINCSHEEIFIPGNDSGTYYFEYARSIDIDSTLKNIDKNLETDANIYNSYVPNSNSDLYLENYNKDVEIPNFRTTNGKKMESYETFNNHTRQQLKNS